MVERQVIQRERQRRLHSDTMDMQDGIRESIDELIRQSVGSANYYSGFAATDTGPYEVTMAAGRLYMGGQMHQLLVDTVFSNDLYNLRPLSQKRIIAVVGWGQEIETTPSGAATEPRQFMVDVTNRVTEVQQVSTRRVRRAVLNLVSGEEAAQPEVPSTGVGNVLIATILVGPTGVEAVTMNEDALLPQAARLLEMILALQNNLGAFGTRVDTIASDMAATNGRMDGFADGDELAAMRAELNSTTALAHRGFDLANKLDAGATYLHDFEDLYVDPRFTDDTGAGYAAVVRDGIEFPDGASQTLANGIELFSADDPKVIINNNLMLPTYTHRLRVDTFAQGRTAREADMQAFSSGSHAVNDVEPPRVTYSYKTSKSRFAHSVTLPEGDTFHSNFALSTQFGVAWAAVGNGESRTIALSNEALSYFKQLLPRSSAQITGIVGTVTHTADKTTVKYAVDYTFEMKVAKRIENIPSTAPSSVDGQGRAETWLQERDGWLTQVGLFFTAKGASGDIRLLVTEVSRDGSPVNGAALANVTIPFADILASPTTTRSAAGIETIVAVPPQLCRAGKRYAVVLISSGGHFVRMTEGVSNVTQGEHWALTDANQWAKPALESRQTMAMRLYFARFNATRVEVDLKPLSLSGGILDVTVDAQIIQPPITNLDFECQPDGTTWGILGPSDGQQIEVDLTGNPELMPFRAVFIGSEDIMPALSTGGAKSIVKSSRPGTALVHWSSAIDAGAAATEIRVLSLLNGFDDTPHDYTVELVTDPEGSPTTEAADSTSDVVREDGRTERTSIFQIAPGQQIFAIKQTGSASAASNVYRVDHIRAAFFS